MMPKWMIATLTISILVVSAVSIFMIKDIENNKTIVNTAALQQEQNIARNNLTDRSSKKTASDSSEHFPSPVAKKISKPTVHDAIEVDEKKLRDTEEKMADLIKKYDENLADKEARNAIEMEATQITKGYKQQVLAKVKLLIKETSDNKPN